MRIVARHAKESGLRLEEEVCDFLLGAVDALEDIDALGEVDAVEEVPLDAEEMNTTSSEHW